MSYAVCLLNVYKYCVNFCYHYILGSGRPKLRQHEPGHEDGQCQVCPQEGRQGQGDREVPRHSGDAESGAHGDVLRYLGRREDLMETSLGT
jgi:hypothetical protein